MGQVLTQSPKSVRKPGQAAEAEIVLLAEGTGVRELLALFDAAREAGGVREALFDPVLVALGTTTL